MINVLSNKENLLKVGKLLGVEYKTCDDVPNNCCIMADMKKSGRKSMRARISNKIYYLICLYHPNYHQQDDAKVMNLYQSMKENLSNLTVWGRK